MDRVFSFDLCHAELIKCARSPFVRGLFVIAVVAMTLILALYELNQNHGRALRYPVSLSLVAGTIAFIGRVVPPIFCAWLFAHEASADTWKTILVRRPHRLPFLTAKVVASVVVVAAVATGGALFQLLAFEATGALSNAPRFPEEAARWTSAAIDGVVCASVAAAVGSAFAAAGAVLARNNGTIIGFVSAYVLQMVESNLVPDVNDPAAALMFTHRATHLGSAWSGVALEPNDAALAVFTVAGDLAVIGAWCAMPLVVAAVVFCRRDLVSGVG